MIGSAPPTRRFYGNPILGDWGILRDGIEVLACTPRTLKARSEEFQWRFFYIPGVAGCKTALWPHVNGQPLIYDEAE